MRRLLYVVACMVVTAAGFALPSRAPALTRGSGLLKQRVEFTVTNPAENGASHQIVGYRFDTFCTSPTAVLLMHGLSYTKEAWDFPGYSVAQKLAEAGYAVFAIDRLGYGESKLQNRHNGTLEAYPPTAAVLTPSGEILSVGKQSSRLVVGNIKVPVFLQFGDSDKLFEVQYAQMHAEEFRSSPSVTVDIVKDAGHALMTTKGGLAGTDR